MKIVFHAPILSRVFFAFMLPLFMFFGMCSSAVFSADESTKNAVQVTSPNFLTQMGIRFTPIE